MNAEEQGAGRAFRSTRDAEICVCGLARAEHYARGEFAGMTKSDKPFCVAFRTSNPTIPNAAHFREVCEHPEKFGGIRWPPDRDPWRSADR